MKRFFLIFHGRFPSEKAASLFVAKECTSFAKENIEVILIVPRRIDLVDSDPYFYYGIEKSFKIIYLPTLDLFRFPLPKKICFLSSFAVFSFFSFLYLIFYAKSEDVIYSNETLPLFFASFVFRKTFYANHFFPEGNFWFYGVFFRRMRWILTTNGWMKKKISEIFKIPEEKILHEPNAVNIDDFDISVSKEDARKNVGLPIEKRIVVYTGHLYSWKGVETLASASAFLQEEYLIVFVGGTESDVKNFSERYGSDKKIIITGWRPYSEIPYWQKAADVLVLPNTAKEKISAFYTSPMKLFEYAASGRPVVASKIPSISEIMDQNSVLFVEPDNPEALAFGIKSSFENRNFSEGLSRNAYEWVKDHTWEKRARRIIEFLG